MQEPPVAGVMFPLLGVGTTQCQCYTSWMRLRERASQRTPAWTSLQALLRHANGLPIVAEIAPQVEAIRSERSLLSDPDPIPPLVGQLAATLRTALQAARQRLVDVRAGELAALEASDEWQRLTESQRTMLVAKHGLGPVDELRLENDAALLVALDATPLTDWEDKVAAFAGRASRAREEAARLLEPQAVTVQLPRRTLKTADEMDAYLSQLRVRILKAIEAGNPVILQ